MLRDRLAAFVDRKDELKMFRRALAGEENRRLLLIADEGERGKSYLLLKIFRECEEGSVPVARLDFDQRKRNVPRDYLDVAREVRRQLGDNCTPTISACDEEMHSRSPLVHVQTGGGNARVNWGKGGSFDSAAVTDIAGRDNISINAVNEAAPELDLAAKWRDEMGRALRDDLAQMGETHSRVVLLVDTFEQAPEETCHWLERWLFDALRRELAHVLVVVAGRPPCEEFFAPELPWSRLVAPLPLTPLTDDDIRQHYQRRGLVIPNGALPTLIEMGRYSPAAMARMADLFEKTRGDAP